MDGQQLGLSNLPHYLINWKDILINLFPKRGLNKLEMSPQKIKCLCCRGDTFKTFNSHRLSEVKGNYVALAKCKCFTNARTNVVFKEVEALKYW